MDLYARAFRRAVKELCEEGRLGEEEAKELLKAEGVPMSESSGR